MSDIPGPRDITGLLLQLIDGHETAMDELMPLVYDRLRVLAHSQLRREGPVAPFKTTELVHETYLKLVDQDRVQWQGRAHFFAVAAMAMRRILVNEAVARKRLKRGEGAQPISIDAAPGVGEQARAVDILLLDEALTRLDAVSERARRVVECRVFVGLTVEETAVALDVAPMTVKRDWQTARAWLLRELATADA